MKKTIGIFAHVDGGKTTFSESLLYHTNSIRNKGRVDHKDAFLDSHSIEKERGITIFSDVATFNYNNSTYYLIDTPGHVDFSAEMERAIGILDYAILIISAVEGIQGHTETIWNLLRKHDIPTFIFINKIDREGSDFKRVLEECENILSNNILNISSKFNCEFSKDEIEFIAERDEELFEIYLEDNYKRELWYERLKKLIKNNKVFPCFKGSALLDEGILEFLEWFDYLSYTCYENEGDFKGRVFKVKYDDKGKRITFIKGISGKIKPKEEIKYIFNGEEVKEKVNEIRIYNGKKHNSLDTAYAGDVFGIVGISKLVSGSGIGLEHDFSYEMVGALKAKVIYDEKLNPMDILKYFRILESEDSSLNVTWNEELKEINISIMGVIQLEVLKDIIRERFNLNIDFGSPEILYKETIEGNVLGYGHFEPLGHYAEVILKIEEGERNSGIIFKNECHTDDLTIGNQNLIRTHIFEREHKGIKIGGPLSDLKITLLTGRAHNKHTSGGDFREATKRALRQGLEGANIKILEPYYKFKIDVHIDLIGRVISDIQRMSGEFMEPKNYKDRVSIKGRGPVSTFMNYGLEFVAFTKGKGNLSMFFDGYDVCHNEEEVIEKIGYKKDSDSEYTSTSIFCSKGQAYLVDSENVKNHMHCLK